MGSKCQTGLIHQTCFPSGGCSGTFIHFLQHNSCGTFSESVCLYVSLCETVGEDATQLGQGVKQQNGSCKTAAVALWAEPIFY